MNTPRSSRIGSNWLWATVILLTLVSFQNCAPPPAEDSKKTVSKRVTATTSGSNFGPGPTAPSTSGSGSISSAGNATKINYVAHAVVASNGVSTLGVISSCVPNSTANSGTTSGTANPPSTSFKEKRIFSCLSEFNRGHFAISTIEMATTAAGAVSFSGQVELRDQTTNQSKHVANFGSQSSGALSLNAVVDGSADNCTSGSIETTSSCTENQKVCGSGFALSASNSTCMATSRSCAVPANAISCTETFNALTGLYGNQVITCASGFAHPSTDASVCKTPTWTSPTVDMRTIHCLDNPTEANFYRIIAVTKKGNGALTISGGGVGHSFVTAREGNSANGGFTITCQLK